ncbi:MAG: YfhO family protein [Lachnospiraceae bacterium]|nr:YfhO family protein [Lachnospiraceae bacterium]
MEKKKRGLKCRIPLEAAVFTAALSCLLFGLFGFWPFGKGSVIVEDLFSQYTPLLYHFFDCVTGKENLFGDIRIAGGLNLYADTINEILNPFNYVLLLFGRENIYLSVNLLLLLYMTAASASAALFLKETFPDSDPVILSLSCAYGLSGYVFYNYQIIKWEYLVVLFPLFLIALRRL